MLRRPHPGETDEDLLKEQEELVAQGALKPSVTLVRPDKRKTDDVAAAALHNTTEPGVSGAAPRSRFGRQRATKKQKESIVDNTVLKEAVRQTGGGVVLGGIVERSVPSDAGRFDWQPQPSPHGFPQPMRLGGNLNEGSSPVPGQKKKSLYMQEVERLRLAKNRGTAASSASSASPAASNSSLDPRVAVLGSPSHVAKGEGVPKDRTEAEDVHRENLEKLGRMSPEEILREQQSLLETLKPEHLQFFKALRKQKAEGREKDAVRPFGAGASVSGRVEAEDTEMECEVSGPALGPIKADDQGNDAPAGSVSFGSEGKPGSEGRGASTLAPGHGGLASEEALESQLPILPTEAKKWVNMDKVEEDKLRWMTDMPPPRPLKSNEGFVARFDFEGNVLPYDAEVSYREALHHHGNEPGRAGYTIDEIFTNIRSQVLQQRHVGLSTLANILCKAKEGFYDTGVNPPVIQLMVEAGAVLLLRYALDENSPLIYGEAARALLHLVSSEPDERCLDLALPWVPAGLEPGVASRVHASDKARQELDKEEAELKDFEVVKLDVIRALIRTDTHNRLRYLLETLKPKPEAVTNILALLTRIARHSLAASWQLADTPRLLQVVLTYFLPENLSPLLTGQCVATMTTVYGVPLRHALRFFRVLASKGRELAARLVNTYEVMARILTYVSLDPSEISIPLQEVLMLCQEAYATWSVFLAYGLSKPVEAVVSFYPLFVKQLIFYRDKVDVNEATDENRFNYDVGAQIVNTLTRAVNVAASHSLLHSKMQLNQGTLIGRDGNSQVLQPPALTWLDLRDLPHLVETCLAKWLSQASRVPRVTFSALKLIGSCCDFLSVYYVKWKDQTSYKPDVSRKMIESLYNNVISQALGTVSFRSLLASLPSNSSLISAQKPGVERDPINLGSLGCVSLGGEIVPVIRPETPFPFLLPLSTLLLSLHSLHPALAHSSTTQFLDSQEITEYFLKLCSSQRSLSEQWLTRIETHFISNLLRLAATTGVSKSELYHQTAMCIMTCVHKGDEYLIKELLTQVICDPKFVTDLSGVSGSVGDLSVRDYEPLKSPALAQPVLTPTQLTATILQFLPAIGSELAKTVITRKEYEASVVLKSGIPFVVNGITVSHTEHPLSLDPHWPLSPIKHAYTSSLTPPKPQESSVETHKSDQSSPEDILTVTRCLQMTYMGLKHRRGTLLRMSSHMSWLQHLSLTFLAASDIFLDPTVSSYLQGCIAEILKFNGYAKLDPRATIDSFTSFDHWYKSLAEHYMSVSYGDSTFALYLVVPLQQYLPKECRTTLWGDLSDALQFIFLSQEQVERFIPLRQYHDPAESDEGLLLKYRASLGARMISAAKNSFLHSLASHHIRLYLTTQKEKSTG